MAERFDGQPHRAVLLCGVARRLEQADEMIVELARLAVRVAIDLPGEATAAEAGAVLADRRAVDRRWRRDDCQRVRLRCLAVWRPAFGLVARGIRSPFGTLLRPS